MATEGYGLVFSINCDYDGCTFGSCGEDPYKVNLDDVGLTEDNRVILPGCTCHACTEGYSRAYIYHLRNTHEMLGDILLTIHNIHHYALWFAKIRSTMDEGKFTEYCNAFAEHHSMETK